VSEDTDVQRRVDSVAEEAVTARYPDRMDSGR
jgi:hypothetical protein